MTIEAGQAKFREINQLGVLGLASKIPCNIRSFFKREASLNIKVTLLNSWNPSKHDFTKLFKGSLETSKEIFPLILNSLMEIREFDFLFNWTGMQLSILNNFFFSTVRIKLLYFLIQSVNSPFINLFQMTNEQVIEFNCNIAFIIGFRTINNSKFCQKLGYWLPYLKVKNSTKWSWNFGSSQTVSSLSGPWLIQLEVAGANIFLWSLSIF